MKHTKQELIDLAEEMLLKAKEYADVLAWDRVHAYIAISRQAHDLASEADVETVK